MIDIFEKSSFSELLNYNDPKVAQYADNVYEKIRQLGILPDFVKRDKVKRSFYNLRNTGTLTPTFAKDNDFTFGYAYAGDKLDVTRTTETEAIPTQINLGKVFQFEFEIKFTEFFSIIELMDGFISIDDSYVFTIGDTTAYPEMNDTDLYKIKIIRNHFDVTMIINGDESNVYWFNLINDDDTLFFTLYELIVLT